MSPEIVNGIFAIAGALIGVGGTWVVTKRFSERKRIAVIVSPLARLLDVGDQVRSDVKIVYKGQDVPSLSMGEAALQNTGTSPVEGLEAFLATMPGAALIDFAVSSANFAHDEKFLQLGGDDTRRTVKIKYLNQNERIVLSYKMAGGTKRPEIVVRQLGVEVVTKSEFVNWVPDIYAEAVFEALSHLPFIALVSRPYRLYREAHKQRQKELPHSS